MTNEYINNQVSEAKMKLEAIVEKAEQEYKNTVTEAMHDFLERNKAYYPDGLRISSYRTHCYHYLHIWNEDGKRVHRTFIEQSNGYQYKPQMTYKLQEDDMDAMDYFGRVIESLTKKISKFEDAEGGTIFEYKGLHFRGTYTRKDLGLEDAPDYVTDEMVNFGYAPQSYCVAGLWYSEESERLRKEWNLQEFHEKAGEGYDAFLCMEDGETYYPAADKLAGISLEYMEKNIRYWIREHEEREDAA